MLVLCYNDARRHSCCLTRIVRRESNAAKRYCNDDDSVNNVSFSDKKIFMVQPPINTQSAATSKKSSVASCRLVNGRKHFNKIVTASVTVSKAGKSSVHFVEKGTKVDASYYRETLLQRCLLSEICWKSYDHLVFHQDDVPSHRAKSSYCSLLCQTSLNLLYGPPNSWDLNSV